MWLLNLVLNLIFIGVSIIPQWQILKRYRKSSNKLNIIIWFLLLVLQINYVFDILAGFESPLLFGARLTRNNLFMIFVAAFELGFLFYLTNAKKFYSLPVVAAFFTFMALFLVDSIIPMMLFTTIAGISSSAFLLIQGRRNNNGYVLSLGLFLLVMGFGFTFLNTFIEPIFQIISLFLLILGTKGFIDKYILVNEEEEKKVKGAWISKMVIKNK
ncbi:MAG: membrane protein of unknown function [Promethearchaeota archaeon]|nr:MAG: membrane protein of unknown function [Candidatus Lokiarchaeota archaeon]